MTPEQLQAQARRKIRTTSRHIAHISKDAGPLALQQLHADLGRAIADLAAANLRAGHQLLDELQQREKGNQGPRQGIAAQITIFDEVHNLTPEQLEVFRAGK